MATFTQPGFASGRPYTFNIAGDKPTVDEQQQIDAYVQQYERDWRDWHAAQGIEISSDKPGLGAVPGQFAAGATGFLGSMGQGIVGGLSPIIPDVIERPIEEGIRGATYGAQKYFAPQTIDEAGMLGKVAEGAGSLAPLIPTMFLNPPAGIAAATSMGILGGAGEARERARKAGVAYSPEGYLSTLGGAAVGSLEAVPVFGKIPGVGKLFPAMADVLDSNPTFKKAVATRVQRALMSGGEEAAQEAVSNTLQNLIEMGYNPEAEPFAGTAESATVGGAVGGAFQVLLDAFLPGRGRGRGAGDTGSAPEATPEATPEVAPSVPPEAAQAEMFPGAELGTAPTPAGTQGELFAGMAPVPTPAVEPGPVSQDQYSLNLDTSQYELALTPEEQRRATFIDEMLARQATGVAQFNESEIQRLKDEQEAIRKAAADRAQALREQGAPKPSRQVKTAQQSLRKQKEDVLAAAKKKLAAAQRELAKKKNPDAIKRHEVIVARLQEKVDIAQQGVNVLTGAETVAPVQTTPTPAPAPEVTPTPEPTPAPEVTPIPVPEPTGTPAQRTSPSFLTPRTEYGTDTAHRKSLDVSNKSKLWDAAQQFNSGNTEQGYKSDFADKLARATDTRSSSTAVEAAFDDVVQLHAEDGGVPEIYAKPAAAIQRVNASDINPAAKAEINDAIRRKALGALGAKKDNRSRHAFADYMTNAEDAGAAFAALKTAPSDGSQIAEARAYVENGPTPLRNALAETPAPAQETPAPAQETQAPAQETQAPAQETPAPAPKPAKPARKRPTTEAKKAKTAKAKRTAKKAGKSEQRAQEDVALQEPLMAAQALEYYRNDADTPASLRRVVNMVLPKLQAKDTRIAYTNEVPVYDAEGNLLPALGAYDAEANTIYIKEDAELHTLLHEALHAVTHADLDAGTSKSAKALAQLAKQYAEYNDGVFRGEVAAQGPHEFVAELFSNPDTLAQVQAMRGTPKINGKPKTFFRHVMDAIGGALGLRPRDGLGDASADLYATLEKLVSSDADNLYAGVFPQLESVDDYKKLNMRQNLMSSVAPKTPDVAYVRQLKELAADDLPVTAMQIGLGFVPLNPIVQMARALKLPYIDQLSRMINSSEASVQREWAVTRKVNDYLVRLSNKDKKNYDALGDLMLDTTSEQVDPSLPKDVAAKRYKNDENKQELYKQFRKRFKALSTDAQQAYVRTKNYSSNLFERFKDQMIRDVRTDLAGSPESAQPVVDKIESLFKYNTALRPYFGLVRKGDYWLTWQEPLVDPVDGTTSLETVSVPFERREQRAAAEAQLRDLIARGETKVKADSIKSMIRDELESAYARGQGGNVRINSVLSALEQNSRHLPEEKRAKLLRDMSKTMVDLLPESALLRTLRGRGGPDGRGVLGATSDPIQSFSEKAFPLARTVALRAHHNELSRTLNKFDNLFASTPTYSDMSPRERQQLDAARELVNTDERYARQIAREVRLRADRVMSLNPHEDKFARAANQTAFLWMMTSPASAFIDLASIPAISYPLLAGKHGLASSAVEITRALGVFRESYFGVGSQMIDVPSGEGSGFETIEVNSEPSIDNFFRLNERGRYVLRDDETVTRLLERKPALAKQLRDIGPLIDAMEANGQLRRSTLRESVVEGGAVDGNKLFNKAMHIATLPKHVAEQSTRQATALAAYKLELAKLRKNNTAGKPDSALQAEAAEAAVRTTLEANGGAGIHTSPRWGQKSIGRVAMLFKGWALNQAALQTRMALDTYRYIKDGVIQGKLNPAELEAAKAGMNQLILMHGMIGVMAGAVGMPIYGLIEMLHDMLADETDDKFDRVSQAWLNNDVLHKGIFQLMGIDVASRVGLSFTDLIIRDNPYLHDKPLSEHLMTHLLGPTWGIVSQLNQARKDFSAGYTWRGAENMSPTPIRNFLTAVRFAREGSLTRTGNSVYDDFHAGDIMAKMLGFAPAEYSKILENSMRTRTIDKAILDRRAELGKKLYFELYHGNGNNVERILKKIQAFNSKHPYAAITFGEGGYIPKSFKQRAKTEREMINGLYISPTNRDALLYYSTIQEAGAL